MIWDALHDVHVTSLIDYIFLNNDVIRLNMYDAYFTPMPANVDVNILIFVMVDVNPKGDHCVFRGCWLHVKC